MPLTPITRLETPSLAIVPLAERHLDDLLEVSGDDAVTRYLPYATWTSRADAQAWLARMLSLGETGNGQQLVLERRADGKAIGTLLLFRYDEGSRRIEIGYALGRAAWGQGLMAEAVRAVCAHAFGALGIRRIEAEVNPANVASCRLLAQVGFQLEGTFRQRWTAKGSTYDTKLYGLLVEEWRP